MTTMRTRLPTKFKATTAALRAAVKPSKYRNQKTVLDGITFASKAEAKRYQELKLLEKAGKISALERQLRWPLTINGKIIAHYACDFTYWDHDIGKRVVEDVKGVETEAFKLKAKMFEACNGFPITIIKA